MNDTELRFCSICHTERETPVRPLEAMALAPSLIREALSIAPHTGEEWPPAFVVAHLADTEVGFGWRVRRVLSEEHPAVAGFDEMRWAQALRYAERDVETSLRAFAALRLLNVEILRRAGDAALAREYAHAEYGRRTLGELVRHRADHDLQHLAQISGGA